MPLGLLVGLTIVGLLCIATGIVMAIRADLRGPAHRVTGNAAGAIFSGLIALVWLGSSLKATPVLQAIGLP